MENNLDRIDARLERMEEKLDRALSAQEAISWLKWIVGGAWLAIAGLFATHK